MSTSAPPAPSNPPQKRAGNLTAGAFDFSFATPTKGKGKEKDARPLGAIGGFGTGAFQTPQRAVPSVKRENRTTARREEGWNAGWGGVTRAAITPMREMSRPSGSASTSAVSLSTLGGMFGEVKTEVGEGMKTPRKMTSLTSITTPWTGRQSQVDQRPSTPDVGGSAKRRRLGDLEVHLPAIKVKEEREDLGRRVALRHMGEGVSLEGVGQFEEPGKDEGEKEVGIGISPRKGRVKWTGRGEPPLALRLNALLTTQSSSLTLFYTSLQHTLHPSISAHRTHQPSSKPKPELVSAPSTLEHIRTAPLRLRLIRPISPREHVAQLWLASVRTWPRPPARSRVMNEEEEEVWPDEVIVNFSQAAKGAAAAGGAGADIKVIAGRWWERVERGVGGSQAEEGRWEVGVWTEWSMVDLPIMQDEGDELEEERAERGRRVVFVSRYLIAERR